MTPEFTHPARLAIDMLLAECAEKHLRRSGPGGQRRNKVETAVQLRHRPTNLLAEASERRSVGENHGVAVQRLRLLLALQVRSESLSRESPTELWRSRCRNEKIIVNPSHVDFPALLAEALDVLQQHHYQLPEASRRLECTSSQLLKLLQKEPRAWQLFNEERIRRGLPTLQLR